jgi:hypothetical protein
MRRHASIPKKYEHIDFTPPEGVANAAAKGLELRQKASPSNRGGLTSEEASKQGIGSGVQRAVNLKNRDTISPKVIKQMRGFLSRSEKSSEISAENKGTPWNDKGYVAWLLWGGDPAKAWTDKVIKQMEAADEKEKQSKQAALMERWGSMLVTADENEPTNPKLWAKVQALAKGEQASMTHGGKTVNGPNDGKGFTVFPSAYANGWASKVYGDLGGGWSKKAGPSPMPATEDCDAMVSTAWVSPQGKMVFLRGQTHEGFAEKWALRNEPDLYAQIVEHGQTARPHASIWHRVMLDRGWLQLQGMSSIVVPPRPSRKQLQNVADFFANCIADGTSDPDRITLHILGLSPSLKGKPIEPGEDRYPFDVQERVSLADFIEREASGPVIEDMYQAMMERTRRASLIEAWGPTLREAARTPFDYSFRGPSEGTARLSDVTFEVRGRGPDIVVFVSSGDGHLGVIEAALNTQSEMEAISPQGADAAKSLRDLGERVGRPDMGVYTVGHSALWDTFRGYGVGKRAYMVFMREAYKRGHAIGPDASWVGNGFGGTSADAERVWKKLGAMPGVEVATGHPFYYGNPKDERVGPDRPRGFRRKKKRYQRKPKYPSIDRVARGKAKKDVGHGGLDEWFSGHGGAKGKGEDATWGDWVSISPVTKTLPSGKKVEKGDIVGDCGISDDPDWKEITKGGEDPLKCMPRQKAHDMPKAERAEKAKAKQKAEKADSSRGKKPTMTPTFDKKKARLQRIQMKREAAARLRAAWGDRD